MNCFLCLSNKTETLAEIKEPKGGVKKYWRCSECRFIFMDPEHRLDRNAEQERYDQHENNPTDPKYREFLNRLAAPLISKLPSGAKGLDFGSGPGPAMSVILRESGYACENYDPIYAPDRNLLAQQYDFLTCTETAEHFYSPRQEFELLDSLLKPGGMLGIMTVLFKEEESFEKWWYVKDPTHVSFYSLRTLEWIASWRNWNFVKPFENVLIFERKS